MLTRKPLLPSGAIRCWKMGLIALGFASFLTGCQTFQPSESISAPSPQLREALGHEVTPIAIYGGVRSSDLRSNGDGALILAQDSLQFREWNESGRYESKGLKIPYANIAMVYSNTLHLVVIERVDGYKVGYRDYSFNFGLLPREAPLSSAEHTLLSLIDRSDTTHLPSPDMWNMRDRVVAVTRWGWRPEFELSGAGLQDSRMATQEGGVSNRAAQGAGYGAQPFSVLGALGGGIAALPLAIVGGAIGATVGAVVGLAEELTAQPSSDSEQARIAKQELEQVNNVNRGLELQTKVTPIQAWLHDSVMTLLMEQGATANAREKGHLFTRVDDLSATQLKEQERVYLPLYREAIDHVLEVAIHKIRLKAPGYIDTQGELNFLLELEGGYRVLSVARGQKLAGAAFECSSVLYPVTVWQAENAQLFRDEIHRCTDQIGEKIVADFLTRFPDATSLRNQSGSDRK